VLAGLHRRTVEMNDSRTFAQTTPRATYATVST